MFGFGNKTFRVEVHMASGKKFVATLPRDGDLNPESVKNFARKCITDGEGFYALNLPGHRRVFASKYIECVEVFD